MKSMTLYDVVKKLLGEIEPVGESNTDERRLENIEQTIALVDRLTFDLGQVRYCKSRQEYSMNRAGKRADEYLNDLALACQE